MSESQTLEHLNTPDAADLAKQIAADEQARLQPEPEIEAAEPEPEPEAEPEPQVEKDDHDYEKRIARLAFKERESRQEARRLAEENARLRGAAPPLERDAEIAQQVEQRAAQLAAQKVYNDAANKVYADGVAAFPDFDMTLGALKQAGLPLSNEVVEAAIEVGDPHKLLHYLGKNLDEAERILALAPHQMGVALAKVASKLAPPAKVQSKAPPPIKPLAGKGKPAEPSDEDMPIDEYMRREDERMRNRRR